MIVATALLTSALAPGMQIEGGQHVLTEGASIVWEQQFDQQASLQETVQFLLRSPIRWIELAKVYDPAGVQDRVVARGFERADGALAWSATSLFTASPGDVGKEVLIEVDSTADGGKAFLFGARDDVFHVAALETATGTVLWDESVGGPSLGSLLYPKSIAASPDGSWLAVVGSSSLSPKDATIVVLSGTDGAQLWSLHGDAFGDPNGAFDMAEASSSTLFVRLTEIVPGAVVSTLHAVDAVGGAVLWQSPLAGLGFDRLVVDPVGNAVGGVTFLLEHFSPFETKIAWSNVNTWDAMTGAHVVHATHLEQAVLGLEFGGSGNELVYATIPSDPPAGTCSEIEVWSHDLAGGTLAWSRAIAPAFGACDTEMGALALTPGAAIVAVQAQNPVPGGRVEVHALDLATGGGLWSELVPPAFDEHHDPLGQLVGDAASIAITTRVKTSSWDGGSTQLTALAALDGALLWTTVDGEDGSSTDYSVDLAVAPDGATLYSLEHVNAAGTQLHALAAATGQTLWTSTLDAKAVGLFGGSASFRGDLLLDPAGDTLFAHVRHYDPNSGQPPVGRLIASDAQTGAERWQIDLADVQTKGFLRRTLARDGAGTRLFVAGGDHVARVQAVSPDGGALLWDQALSFPGGGGGQVFEGVRDSVHSDATGLLYVLSSFYDTGGGTSDADVLVAALDAWTGAVVWSRQFDPGPEWLYQDAVSLSVDPTGERVVIAFTEGISIPKASRVVALDATTGADRWSQALTGAGQLVHVRIVEHALEGERVVVAGSGAIDDPSFRVVAAAFDPSGVPVWETSVPTVFPVELNRVLASEDGTALAVIASLPYSSWKLPAYQQQGVVVLWLDAVDGTVLWSGTLTTPAAGYVVRTQIQDAELTDAGLLLGGLHFDYPAGKTMDRYLARYALPTLTTDASELSVTQGGTIPMHLRPGHETAGHFYLVVGSITGTAPGIPLQPGVVLPLVFDAWTNLTLLHAGDPTILPDTLGVLDGYGRASAAYIGQQSGAIALVGLELYHAFATLNPASGKIGPASNPIATPFGF